MLAVQPPGEAHPIVVGIGAEALDVVIVAIGARNADAVYDEARKALPEVRQVPSRGNGAPTSEGQGDE